MVWMTLDREWMDSFRDMERMKHAMNRVMDDYGSRPADWPSLNVWADEESAVVTAEIPGLDPEDLDLSVTGAVLRISGERKPESIGPEARYHRQERGYGRFTRSVRLPFEAEGDQVKAEFKNGILEIRLPRREDSKPRKIEIHEK